MRKSIKKRILKNLILTACFLVCSVTSYGERLPKSLVGVYIIEELGFYREIIQVEYQKGSFSIREYQSGKWGIPQAVHPVNKAEFENLLQEPVNYGFSGLANDTVALFKVPKGWSSGNFTCNTGYWLMTLIGPVELIKK